MKPLLIRNHPRRENRVNNHNEVDEGEGVTDEGDKDDIMITTEVVEGAVVGVVVISTTMMIRPVEDVAVVEGIIMIGEAGVAEEAVRNEVAKVADVGNVTRENQRKRHNNNIWRLAKEKIMLQRMVVGIVDSLHMF